MHHFFAVAQTTQQITAETSIPIGIAVIVAVFIVGIAIKLLRRLDRIENGLSAINQRMDEEWTVKDQEVFALRLQISNQKLELHVPDPRDIARNHRVKGE